MRSSESYGENGYYLACALYIHDNDSELPYSIITCQHAVTLCLFVFFLDFSLVSLKGCVLFGINTPFLCHPHTSGGPGCLNNEVQ